MAINNLVTDHLHLGMKLPVLFLTQTLNIISLSVCMPNSMTIGEAFEKKTHAYLVAFAINHGNGVSYTPLDVFGKWYMVYGI